ncbi:BON domain-containing protein [uncultured Desulfobacter sp.]|uniref:BON domain-containing protein n=1 Tax=uncultured Desulfobacter sp. TaxID=240139 RepID=UPI002AAB2E7E|nr:BON domain-containing protein [uncultured Desulfobacter sp.]
MKMRIYTLALLVSIIALTVTYSSLFASETDDRIESSARQSYVFQTYLKDEDIKIHSQDGHVTLTGTASSDAYKSLARETVAGLSGVKDVDNQLAVKGEAVSGYSDAWLAAKVKSTLFFHRNVSAGNTEVSAKNGTITLVGDAKSLAQKDLTTEYVLDIDGVKHVNNEMTVQGAATWPGKKQTEEKMEEIVQVIDDASITAMVKMTLLYHRSTSAVATTVETKDGVVTLGGKARNKAEKALATKLVRDVHGVKKVTNLMTIAG